MKVFPADKEEVGVGEGFMPGTKEPKRLRNPAEIWLLVRISMITNIKPRKIRIILLDDIRGL